MNARLALAAAALLGGVMTFANAPTFAQTPAAKPAAKAPGPDVARGQQIATQQCAACHAADGNSTIPANPVLAGQGYDYLLKQLRNFKIPAGKDGARPNPIMTAQVTNIGDDDLKNLAAYYAGQKPKGNAAKNKETVLLGEKIYRGGVADRGIAACSGCHSPNGAGVPAQFPRLAGQHADYTEAQMKAWRTGERANDPNQMMRMVASKLSDREIKAVSDYIAGLR
jgi:cytochrome c553